MGAMGGFVGRRCSKTDLRCEGRWESLERDWGREIIRGGRRRVRSSIARMAKGGMRVSSRILCLRFRLWVVLGGELGELGELLLRTAVWIFVSLVYLFFPRSRLNSMYA